MDEETRGGGEGEVINVIYSIDSLFVFSAADFDFLLLWPATIH
jgi:hypothetical protein